MTDRVSTVVLSKIMARIRSRNTKPEKWLCFYLHARGFRFRVHVKDFPGRPDVVLPKYRAVIFVHGCFWHQHPGCKHCHIPKSNIQYWNRKLERNVARALVHERELRALGWHVKVLWECEIRLGNSDRAVLDQLAEDLVTGS